MGVELKEISKFNSRAGQSNHNQSPWGLTFYLGFVILTMYSSKASVQRFIGASKRTHEAKLAYPLYGL